MTCEEYSILANASRMTWAVFEVDGQIVIHMNTHLQNRGQNYVYSNDTLQKIRSLERIKSFTMMQEKLAEIQKKYPNTPVFMTGDWNDHEYSPIFNAVYDAGYVSSHLATVEKYGPAGSMNGAYDDSVQGDCYPANKDKEGTSSAYLDYCFISSDIKALKFISCKGKGEITLADGTKKTIYTSDHLPIMVDLCLKKS
jgi:endonuclease/exonuclease/phosphatase family metal-dependent hydrolase